MHLSANVVRDETYDAFTIAGRQTFAGIDMAASQPVNPQPTVRVEHDLDDGGVFQPLRDGCPECGTQHARAA